MGNLWAGIVPAMAGLVVAAASPAQPFVPDPFGPEPQGQTKVVRAFAPGGGSYLGVGLQEIDSERAKALKLKHEEGVEITWVEDDSPAAKAGLKKGDVVLQFNGQHVEGIEQFSRMVRETPSGRDVKLLVSRDGGQHAVIAKVSSRKGMTVREMPRMEIPRVQVPPMPDMPRSFMMWRSGVLGVEAEALRGQLAEYFGVKEGVLVRSVMKDTPADKAGIKAGDVILKVGDTKVTTPGDVSSALHAIHGKTTVTLQLLREKRETSVTVTIEGEQGWDMHSPVIRISGQDGR